MRDRPLLLRCGDRLLDVLASGGPLLLAGHVDLLQIGFLPACRNPPHECKAIAAGSLSPGHGRRASPLGAGVWPPNFPRPPPPPPPPPKTPPPKEARQYARR